ncbi:MAG: polyphosphate kinase 1 [Phycisphaerales bacterium]
MNSGKRTKLRLAGDEPAAAGEAGDAKFFSRDLSWLEFNRRVLAQAADARVPLLERVKFLGIFSSNLDEFFMKRVGLLRRQLHSGGDQMLPSGHTARELLSEVRSAVVGLQDERFRIYAQELVPSLAKVGIQVLRYQDLTGKDKAWLSEAFRANIFPALTPLAVDPGHRFPFISNLSENLALLATAPLHPAHAAALGASAGEDAPQFARVKIPPTLKKFITLPTHSGSKDVRLVALSDTIRNHLGELFPGTSIHEQIHFRVTRSAGIQRGDPGALVEGDNLLTSVEAELKQRKFAKAVRLEIEPDPSPVLLRQLLDKLNLDQQDAYERAGPMDYSALFEIAELDRPDLREKPWRGVVPSRLVTEPASGSAGMFAALRKQDVLVHHPYESFRDSVERFIATAAADPDVVAIKQTLYRTSPDSPFIQSMIRAAEAGKQVACLVELRARFDEDRNVRFARQLEKAGVHVAYGVLGLKTHSKTSLVVRKERQGLRCYAHIGTGNYHPKTAQLYTDVGLLTADQELTSDLVNLFNYLTGLSTPQAFGKLLVAPFNMRQRFAELIAREATNAKRGLPARIIAKFNSLEDLDITERLYAASQAGVKITLIVRGFCCLRPGVKGLSENIRVISVIGRFLEHSRIFHFAAGQEDVLDGDWYIGSADWMHRNLNTRVEAACPVEDPTARRRLLRILEVSLEDGRNAWELLSTGSYTRRTHAGDAAADSPGVMGTFATLMADAQAG